MLREMGIVYTTSAIYSPVWIKVVEQINRSFSDSVRAMLRESCMVLELWRDVLSHVTTLLNYPLSSTHNTTTLHALLLIATPDSWMFRSFACAASIHIGKKARNCKLEGHRQQGTNFKTSNGLFRVYPILLENNRCVKLWSIRREKLSRNSFEMYE